MCIHKKSLYRYIAHVLFLFVECMLIAFLIGVAYFTPKMHYTRVGDDLTVEFEADQSDVLRDIDHMIIFCSTKEEEDMFKSSKQTAMVKFDGSGMTKKYVLKNIPPTAWRFRLEFRFKKGVDDVLRWPVIKRMRFGRYDLDVEKLYKFFYDKGKLPSYQCLAMPEWPFGGNSVEIILLGLTLFAVIIGWWAWVIKHECRAGTTVTRA